MGLGNHAELTAERARVAAAEAQGRARELSTSGLCWWLPEDAAPAISQALVEGTLLAAYRFTRYKSKAAESPSPQTRELERLIIHAPGASDPRHAEAVARGAVVAEAANATRDLQNLPPNDLTPGALGEHARGSQASSRPGRRDRGPRGDRGPRNGGLRGGGPGQLSGAGADHPPLRGPRRTGSAARLRGKAVTFDSGGISLKPAAKMAEMKFDMSGGAAVLEAVGAIARLELPVRLLAVVGATENLPGGRAVKPGDIVRAQNGTTIEVNNTDAEGRLVLADCLCHAAALGAERIVDLATLTGGVLIALGTTHAGLLSNDDELAGRVVAAGADSGEIVWRLPLHEEYQELVKGRYADLDNAPEGTQGEHDRGRDVSVELRRRGALGAPRHRRLGLGSGEGVRAEGGIGLRRAPARRAGPLLRALSRLLDAP